MRFLRGRWWFQLVVSAGFIALALWRVDVTEVAEPLGRANYAWAMPALFVAIVTKVIETVRWQTYLSKVGRIPLPSLLGAAYIGSLGNNLLPMRAGDIARVQILANRFGVSRAGLAATVFVVEAVMDGVTFLVLLLIGLALLDVAFVPALLLWALAIIAGGSFVLTVAISRFFPRDLPQRRWFKPLPGRLRESLDELWPQFLDGLETMRNYRLLAWAIILNFGDWLSQVVMFWLFGQAFGLDLSFGSYVVIMIAANLVVAVPITFQNIGTYEVVLLEVLAASGVARQDAFAYAAATHLLTNFWVVALGLAALWLMRISPREVIALGRRADAQTPHPQKARPVTR